MLPSSSLPPVILLAGPTAVGKTQLALEIAHRLGTEIINCDSMQVYRYMEIGTAKPTPEERALVAHHLLDVADPDEPFDAARYAELARPVIESLRNRGKVPLIVGGTGLYMKVLTRGICPAAPRDPAIREQLRRELEEHGLERLYQELGRVDPEAGRRLHPHDRQRVLRALEVQRLTGIPLSCWQSQHRFQQTIYRTVKIFLYRDRNVLYERINRRVRQMLEQGLVAEVRRLLAMGYGPELKSMQAVGYKQLAAHLLGACPLASAVTDMERATRHYARRQLTWFRGDPEFRWVQADDRQGILEWLNRTATS